MTATIKISEWEKHFPDGIAMSTYQRIGRLIREKGTQAKITINVWTDDGLRTALDKLEKQK